MAGNGQSNGSLLVSATGIEQQVNALDLASAQSLFAVTLAVTCAGLPELSRLPQTKLFGQVYLYRLLLREAGNRRV